MHRRDQPAENQPLLIVCAIVYCLAFLIAFQVSRYDISLADEGFYLESIDRLEQGQLPFRDFYCSYFPGRYYVGAILSRLSGGTLLTFRWLHVFLWSSIPVMAFLVAHRLMSNGLAFFVTLPLIVMPGPYYNRWYTFAVVINLLMLARALEKMTKRRIIVAGFTAGMMVWVRQDVGLVAICVGIFSMMTMKLIGFKIANPSSEAHSARSASRSLHPTRMSPNTHGISRLFCLTALLPLTPLVVGVIFNESFREGVCITMEFALKAYHDRWRVPAPPVLSFVSKGLSTWSDIWELYLRVLFHIPFLIVCAHCLILVRHLRHSNNLSSGTGRIMSPLNATLMINLILILWQVSAIYYVSFRSVSVHLLVSAAPFWIACGVVFRGNVTGRPVIRSNISLRTPLSQVIKQCFRSAIICLIFFSIIFGFVGGDARTGSPAVMWNEWSVPRHERIDVYLDNVTSHQLLTIDRLIKARTDCSEYFVSFPCLSMFNFTVERRNPLYYIWLTPDVVRAGVEDSVIENLSRSQPPYVLMYDFAIDGREERRFSHYAPKLFAWLNMNYISIISLDHAGSGYPYVLMQRENGVIANDIGKQLMDRTITPLNVSGSVRFERMDLGRGKIPYLMMRAQSSLILDVVLPESDEIDLAFSKPLAVSASADVRKWHDDYRITFTIMDDAEHNRISDVDATSGTIIECETTELSLEPRGQYCQCSAVAEKQVRIKVSCTTRPDSPLSLLDSWCAIGGIRIVARVTTMKKILGAADGDHYPHVLPLLDEEISLKEDTRD